MIERDLFAQLLKGLAPNKVVVLYGPRRVGKTTLLQRIATHLKKVKYVDGEDRGIQEIFSSTRIQTLKNFLGSYQCLIVDEAQKIPHIGANLKLIVDHIPALQVIASGSASFSLAEELGEPLTGRKKTLKLFPLSLRELLGHFGEENQTSLVEQMLLYGGYPEGVSLDNDERAAYLKELINASLFRDILEMENIRNPKKLQDLLILLAFQIGKEVSLSELGTQLELHKDTVFRYLDLLEKAFVLINIRGFSRNLRKEVTKSSRYYFYDNGIRNALINNFNPLRLRDDLGALWENFVVVEHLKKQAYENQLVNNYFWRTYDQQEIDWVEEREGRLFAYEIKWKAPSRPKRAPSNWLKSYPKASFQWVTQDNFMEFI